MNLKEKLSLNKELIFNLKEKGRQFVSFSSLNLVSQCPRAYRMNYIDKLGVVGDNIYTYLGTIAHDLIERLYREEITNEQALKEWEDKFKNMDYVFVPYENALNEKTRVEMKEKNDKYSESYYNSIYHYFKNFKKSNHKKFIQEEMTILDFGKFFKSKPYNNFMFNGKIDFIGANVDNKTIDIIDYKTSTLYQGEKKQLHSYQLILYAMSLESLGYTIGNIGWDFLKYAKKIKKFKNGSMNETIVKRTDLTDKDEFENAYVFIEYNLETKKEALKWVFSNIHKIVLLELHKDKDYNKVPLNYEPFYCKNLCGFYSLCDVKD